MRITIKPRLYFTGGNSLRDNSLRGNSLRGNSLRGNSLRGNSLRGNLLRDNSLRSDLSRSFSFSLRRFLALLLLLLASPMLVSCGAFSTKLGSGSNQGSFSGGDGSGLDIVNDVPIPQGAVLDNDRSLVLGRGSNWTGRLVFRVNRPTSAIFSLYQSEMPQFGWQSISVIQDEVGILQYVMGGRFVTVRVSGSGLRGSRVSILMAPRSDNSTQSPVSPGAPRQQ